MTTHQAIVHAVALLRNPARLGEVSIYTTLVERGVERHLAARLVEFLPMVYCRLVLADSGLRFPATYRRVLPDGNHSAPFPFSGEPIWKDVMEFAKAEIHGGARSEALLAIAGRSAEFDAANKLLNRGAKLENINFTEPVLLWLSSGPPLNS